MSRNIFHRGKYLFFGWVNANKTGWEFIVNANTGFIAFKNKRMKVNTSRIKNKYEPIPIIKMYVESYNLQTKYQEYFFV